MTSPYRVWELPHICSKSILKIYGKVGNKKKTKPKTFFDCLPGIEIYQSVSVYLSLFLSRVLSLVDRPYLELELYHRRVRIVVPWRSQKQCHSFIEF